MRKQKTPGNMDEAELATHHFANGDLSFNLRLRGILANAADAEQALAILQLATAHVEAWCEERDRHGWEDLTDGA